LLGGRIASYIGEKWVSQSFSMLSLFASCLSDAKIDEYKRVMAGESKMEPSDYRHIVEFVFEPLQGPRGVVINPEM
jgi:hypothetical protein